MCRKIQFQLAEFSFEHNEGKRAYLVREQSSLSLVWCHRSNKLWLDQTCSGHQKEYLCNMNLGLWWGLDKEGQVDKGKQIMLLILLREEAWWGLRAMTAQALEKRCWKLSRFGIHLSYASQFSPLSELVIYTSLKAKMRSGMPLSDRVLMQVPRFHT